MEKIVTYLNFAKKKKAVYLGIKSVLRNKHKIKLIITIDSGLSDNLIKDIAYLENEFSIKKINVNKEKLEGISFEMPESLKIIGVSDEDLANAISNCN